MWAADTANNKVSDADNEVNFVFNHIQTAVNVVVIRAESYTGAGVVADLAVESDGLASAATLDASTGTFVDGSVTGAGTAIAIAQQFTLDGTTKAQQENPFMLVPVDGQTEAFTISATIDGKPYSVAAVMPNNFTGYLAGKVYTINVAVQNTGLVVKGVTIVNDWEVINLGDAQLKPGQGEVQDPYADWVKATYTVTDISTATQFFYSYVDFDISNVSEMAVLENDGSRVAGEPISVTPSKTFQFTTTGTHTVYVKFVDMTQVPDEAFENCDELTSVTIPNLVTSLAEYAFYECGFLKDATLPNTLTSIGARVFSYCNGLTEINIPESVKTIGDAAFETCGISKVTIPKSVVSIGMIAFEGCKNLSQIVVDEGNQVFDSRDNCNAIIETATNTLIQACNKTIIPETVTSIGQNAFDMCEGLTNITIPESVKNIGDAAFYGCSGLSTITSHATTAPTINIKSHPNRVAFYFQQ